MFEVLTRDTRTLRASPCLRAPLENARADCPMHPCMHPWPADPAFRLYNMIIRQHLFKSLPQDQFNVTLTLTPYPSHRLSAYGVFDRFASIAQKRATLTAAMEGASRPSNSCSPKGEDEAVMNTNEWLGLARKHEATNPALPAEVFPASSALHKHQSSG